MVMEAGQEFAKICKSLQAGENPFAVYVSLRAREQNSRHKYLDELMTCIMTNYI